MPYRGTANHGTIGTILFHHIYSLFGRIDVAVAKHRYFKAWVIFYFFYPLPTGTAVIHLVFSTAVYTYSLYAYILQALGHFYYTYAVIIPTKAGFYGNRQFGAFNYSCRKRYHFIYIAQYTRACITAHHVFNRATVVNIKYFGFSFFYYGGTAYHGIFFATKNLYAYRAFIFVYIQLFHALIRIAYKAIGTYKLGVQHVGPVLFAQVAKRRIAHVFHGRQQQGHIG